MIFPPFKNVFTLPPVPNISSMDNTGIFGNAYDDEDVEEEVDMNNVISSYTVPDTSFTKFHKDHLKIKTFRLEQKSDGIFINQDKYVAEILKKFDFASVKTASTPIETNKALLKDEEAEHVDVVVPGAEDTILGDIDAQTTFETTSKQFNDPPLSKVTTFRSGEDNMQLMELMTHEDETFTESSNIESSISIFTWKMQKLPEEVGEDSDHPTDSNQIPIVDQPSTSSQPKQKQKSKRKQRKEAEVAHDETEHEESVTTPSNDPLPSAIENVSRPEEGRKARKKRDKMMHPNRGGELKILMQMLSLDGDECVMDATTGEKDEQSTKLDDSTGGQAVTTTGVEDSALPTIPTTVEETICAIRLLMELKAAKPKAKGNVFHDTGKSGIKSNTYSHTIQNQRLKEKASCMRPVRPLTREDRKLEKPKERKANIALIESWENTQAMMEPDRLLAEETTNKEKERS
ncbi:hypothetical protein Tco_0431885 [Tanacetum coccineum]